MQQCGWEETALTQRLHCAVLCLARHEDRCLEYTTHQNSSDKQKGCLEAPGYGLGVTQLTNL